MSAEPLSAPPVPLTKGYQTTEFWLSLICALINALILSGVIAPNSPLCQALAPIGLAISGAGYAHSRGMTKSSLVTLLCILFAIPLLSGCVMYQRTAPDGTKVAASALFMKVDAIQVVDKSTNGVSHSTTVGALSGDAQMIQAITAGAVQGAMSGAK